MADCTPPQNWNLPVTATSLPVMETTPLPANSPPPRTAAPAGSGSGSGSGLLWLLAAGAAAVYLASDSSKKGLNGTDDEDALNGTPARRKAAPRAKPAAPSNPTPARPVPRPRTHGRHVASLTIS